MQRVIFVVGPTAVGKTDIAFKLAKKFNGELVNADSIQVYKGLDVISGKDISTAGKFSKLSSVSLDKIDVGFYTHLNIPIFLLDVVAPDFSFSVSHFQNVGRKVIQLILSKKKLPIVVGGTGLYIKSLTSDIATSQIKPDLQLRKKLEKLEVSELQEMLKKIDIEKLTNMNNSDVNNSRRLIRAIEIEKSRIKGSELTIKDNKEYKILVIGLGCSRKVLKQRIDARVDIRLRDGALKEAEGLFQDYKNLSSQVKDANGYKQLFQYLKKEIDFDEATYRWKVSEYRHAKNQMTWFRKYGDVEWFDIEEKDFEKKIENSLKKFLS